MEDKNWSYEGATRPDHWGKLDPAYRACALGCRQSPIDIREPAPAALAPLEPDYQPVPVRLCDTGHSIQQDFPAGSILRIGNEEWEPLQFHFHAPSEHALEGELTDLEMHVVHRNPGWDNLLVLGILFEEGEANPVLEELWRHLPGESAGPAPDDFDLGRLLPGDLSHFSYDGSLTTPPCTEGVQWRVLRKVLPISLDQLVRFQKLYTGNNRPVQALNGRIVQVSAKK